MQCMPIFIAFDQSSAGHYDAVTQTTHFERSCGVEKSVKCKARVSAVDVDKEQKKEKDIVSCDQFKKRRKCFQGVRSCADNSHCLGCENPYGKKSIKGTRLEQVQVKEKGGLLR